MRPMNLSSLRPSAVLLCALLVLSCITPRGEVHSLKPSAPPANAGLPLSDPPPSRVVLHATIFREALTKKLAESLPRSGEGEAELVAGQKVRYTWQREPVSLKFDRGRIVVGVNVRGRFNLLGERELPLSISIAGEPVVTADFKALMQSTEVQVKASGPVEGVNRAIEDKLRGLIAKALEEFRMDVRPLLSSAFARLTRPLEFLVGDQVACAELKVTSLEAAPTVLADGLEKDFGIVILPSVTLPCTTVAQHAASMADRPATGALAVTVSASLSDGGSPPADAGTGPVDAGTHVDAGTGPVDAGTHVDAGTLAPQASPAAAPVSMPLLANVSTLPSGPFRVVVPVAARYEEMSRALESSMKGRVHFSSSHPELYMEKPEVYPSDDTIVIKMRLGGNASVAGLAVPVDGEIYFSGHPRVIDNQITVPDLEITPGTASELVKLKFALDYESVRDQARAALRVDVSERLAAVREKLSTELSFSEDLGCVRAQVLRAEVTGIFPHAGFLRIYTQVDAQASLYLPCKR